MPITSRTLLKALADSLRIDVTGADSTAIGAGHTTGWRILPGCTTAFVVGITIQLERRAMPPVTVHPGEAFCMAPARHHRSTVTTGLGVSHWSLFDCRIFASVGLMSLVALPEVLTGSAARRLGDINAALGISLRDEAGLASVLRSQALAGDLVSFLVDAGSMRPEAEVLLLHAERLMPVLRHLEEHLAAPVSRAGLARLAGLSPSRFHALFRTAMGVSPVAYALGRRLQHASHLLIASDLAVSEVGSRVGFCDPFYFSRIFKQRMHVSPARYRQRARVGLEGASRGSLVRSPRSDS